MGVGRIRSPLMKHSLALNSRKTDFIILRCPLMGMAFIFPTAHMSYAKPCAGRIL